MNVSIQPFTENDLEAVAKLEQKAGDVRWTRTHFESELGSEIGRFFVLRQGSNILGYGGYWNVQGEAQITNLVVSPDIRRQGVGSHLLQFLMDHAAAEGCARVTLEVREKNQPAHALYKKAGFGVQGKRPNVYTEPADNAILMEKTL
jgi:ribosomal-protein-alanine acetyltransferase